MNLRECCNELNRRGSGPVVSVEAHPCEDGDTIMIYLYGQNSGAIATGLLPWSIRDAEDKAAVVQNSKNWQIHDYPEHVE